MAENIDALQLQISADATSAEASIERLANSLTKMSTALTGVNSGQFQILATGVNALSESLVKFTTSVNPSDFSTIVGYLATLTSIDTTYVNQTAEALNTLSASMYRIGGAGMDFTSLDALVDALTKLGYEKVNQAAQNIPMLTESLTVLGDAVKGLDIDEAKISSISELASALTKLGNVASTKGSAANLSSLTASLKDMMTTLSRAPHVSSDVVALAQAMAQLSTTTTGTSGATRSLSSSLNLFSTSATKATKKTFSLAAAFGKFYASFWIVLRLFDLFKKAIDISSDITEVQNVVDTAFGDMAYKVEEFTATSIQDFGISELTAKTIAGRYQAMANAMKLSTESVGKANDFLNKATNGYVEASDAVADMSINLTKLAADMGSFYNVDVEDVAESLNAVFTGQTRPLRQYGIDLTQATLQEWALKNGLDADIASMTQAEKTMLRYEYVMANTIQAQGDFQKTYYSWANQTRMLSQNFQALGKQVGNVLTNAFKPVVAWINTLIQSITALAETISNALGHIFGWVYESGGGGTTAVDDIASGVDDIDSGLGGAADNAAKLKKYLLGIDELNVLEPNEDTGSGGGSGSGGGGGAAEAETGEWVRTETIWDEFMSDIDTLYDLGAYISGVLSDAMESIDWDAIYAKASNFGTGLAEFLNGLITPRLFGDLGMTLANSLNTVFHALDSFGTTFDWTNFGNSIGEGINKFFSNFDWELLGSTVATWGNGLVSYVIAKLSTIDFGAITLDIATAINTFFAEFDFGQLAQMLNVWASSLVDFVAGMVSNIDWSSVIQALEDFFGNLDISTVGVIIGVVTLKNIGSFIIGGGLLKALGKMLTNALFPGGVFSISTLKVSIGNFVKGVFAKVSGLLSEVLDFIFPGGIFSITSVVVDIGEFISGALNGGNAFFYTVGDWIITGIDNFINDNFGEELTNQIGNVLAGFSVGGVAGAWLGPAGMVAGALIGSIVGALANIDIGEYNVLETIMDTLFNWDETISMFEEAGERLKEGWQSFLDIFTGEDVLANFLDAGKNLLLGIVEGFAGAITFILEPIFDLFDTIIGGICSIFGIGSPAKEMEPYGENILLGMVEGFLAAIPEFISSIIDWAGDAIEQFGESVADIISNVVEFFGDLPGNIYDTIIGFVDNIIEWGSESISTFSETVTEIIDNIVTWFTELPGKIFDTIIGFLDNIFQWGDESDQTFSEAVTTMIDNVVTFFSELPGKIYEELCHVIEKFTEWKDDAIQFFTEKVPEIIQSLLEDFENLPEKFLEIGSNIISGLWQGIQNAWDGLKKGVSGFCSNIVGWFKDALDINSPSKKTEEIGEYTIEGLMLPFEKNTDLSSVVSLANGIIDTLSNSLSPSVMKQIGEDAVNALAEGFSADKVNSALKNITKAFEETWNTVISWLSGTALPKWWSTWESNFSTSLWVSKSSGMVNGLMQVWNDFMNQFNASFSNWWNSMIVAYFTTDKWVATTTGMKTGTMQVWNEFLSEWKSSFTTWWNSDLTPFFTHDKWYEITTGMHTGTMAQWNDLLNDWKDSFTNWWENDLLPYFTNDKWVEVTEGMRTGTMQQFSALTEEWKTAIEEWWSSQVTPYFTEEQWTSFGTNMKNGIMSGFNGVTGEVQTVLNNMLNAFQTAINNLVRALNEFVSDYNSAASEMEGASSITKTFSAINVAPVSAYASGGFPQRGELFMAREAGPEYVGSFGSSGRTAVANNDQIISGIASGVAEAMASQNAILEETNDLLTELINKDTSITLNGRSVVSEIDTTRSRSGYNFRG